MDDWDEQRKKNNENERLEKARKEREEKNRKLFARIFKKDKNKPSENAKGGCFSTLIFIAWIVGIIYFKAQEAYLGDVLLTALLVVLGIVLVVAILKLGLKAIPYLIGIIFGGIILLIKWIFTKIFSKKSEGETNEEN